MKKLIYFIVLLFIPFCTYSESIVSVSPSTGVTGQTLTVTITGSGTSFTQSSNTSISLSNVSSNTTIFNSSSRINSDTSIDSNFYIPLNAAIGDYNVNILGLTLVNGFHVTANTLTFLSSANPTYATVGQTLNVTITGNLTHFSQATNTINFSQGSNTLVANSVSTISNTSIQANVTIPVGAAIGNYNINLQNLIDGNLTLTNGFSIYAAPTPAITLSLIHISEPTRPY